jgi:adenylate cyclase class 2
MNMEVEVKVKVENLEEVKKKLEELGTKFEAPKKQVDDYYKQKGKEMERQSKGSYLLRIRREDKNSFFTMKVLTGTRGIWEEYETKIDNLNEMEKILEKLGFSKVISKVKTREQGKLDDFEINLDKIEGLGDFVEFQLISNNGEEAKKRILEIIEKLKLPRENVIHKGYARLLFEKMGVKYEDN